MDFRHRLYRHFSVFYVNQIHLLSEKLYTGQISKIEFEHCLEILAQEINKDWGNLCFSAKLEMVSSWDFIKKLTPHSVDPPGEV